DQTPLAPGDSYTISRKVTVPAAMEPTSSDQLLIRTDVNNQQPENDDSNNELAVPITVSAPDLVVTDFQAPSSGVPGQPFQVSWTVKNQGSVTAYGDWNDYVYISSNSQYYYYGSAILTQPTGDKTPLAPGESYTVTTNVTVPSYYSGGRYYLFLYADG